MKAEQINPQELRIGSWVDPIDAPYMQVISISNGGVTVYIRGAEDDGWDYDMDGIRPIPLTPQILEKIEGVVKDGKYESFYYLDHQLFSCRVYKKVGLPMEIMVGSIVRDNIEHLHTFQNLIFALTQTELQIKL
jgi:hypothetical protein